VLEAATRPPTRNLPMYLHVCACEAGSMLATKAGQCKSDIVVASSSLQTRASALMLNPWALVTRCHDPPSARSPRPNVSNTPRREAHYSQQDHPTQKRARSVLEKRMIETVSHHPSTLHDSVEGRLHSPGSPPRRFSP